ncbi:beta-lactamase family protein [Brachybacterium halotolerans subsp. kimchii]|uniref:serine hydrolase domain-containing protein n=1 Tax=Brachybacterium halotolerans TaxID=2795215 RepID=UPI001E2FF449|nr:serine hydrolase domain-containing protein [Brachybacterium halotolerans]UEJ82706.1 beta-lactamase family protein [Brachybacterium halotolerans subsp. kimchii]
MSARPDAQHEGLQALVDALLARARGERSGADGSSADGAVEDSVEGAGAVAAGISGPDVVDGGSLRIFGGAAVSFAADGTPLPDPVGPVDPAGPADPVGPVDPAGPGTLFDMASVTKVVTALTAATLLADGSLDLEDRAAELLDPALVPDARITVRHLLTHTAGLPPTMPLWRGDGSREQRLAAIGRADLASAPGTAHAYSCIGFILLGEILARLGGKDLPALARERVLAPAGATRATWWPDDDARARAAATEFQEDPPRGLVRGEVHDETAWALGGVGNAGLFATLDDSLAIARVLAGTAPGPRFPEDLRREIGRDQLTLPATTGAPWCQGLGVRIGQELPDGSLVPGVLGHPGFTGTALWADPATGTVAALLTNRVHPRRGRFEVLGARRETARLAFAPASAGPRP